MYIVAFWRHEDDDDSSGALGLENSVISKELFIYKLSLSRRLLATATTIAVETNIRISSFVLSLFCAALLMAVVWEKDYEDYWRSEWKFSETSRTWKMFL